MINFGFWWTSTHFPSFPTCLRSHTRPYIHRRRRHHSEEGERIFCPPSFCLPAHSVRAPPPPPRPARLCEVFGPKEAEDKSFQESEIVNRRHIGQRPNRRAWRLEATVKQQQKQELILLWLKRKEGNSVCHSLILPFSSPPGGE